MELGAADAHLMELSVLSTDDTEFILRIQSHLRVWHFLFFSD